MGVKDPRAPFEWGWYDVIPARQRGVDPRDGAVKRHPLHERVVQKAVRAAGVATPVAPPGFGTRWPRTCWKTGILIGRCRGCWGTGA